MKINQKLIEEVASRIAGEDVIPVVHALMNKRDVSEFKLATDTKLEINLVRNMLYRLYNANLVTSIKKKDKKKGWYIYYWTLNLPRFSYLAKDIIRNKLVQLKERLEREKSSHFYLCSRNCIRLNFEQATDFEFKCPECGGLLHQDDNTKKIKEIEKEIKNLEKDLAKNVPPMPKMSALKPDEKEKKTLKKKKNKSKKPTPKKTKKKTKKKPSKKAKKKQKKRVKKKIIKQKKKTSKKKKGKKKKKV